MSTEEALVKKMEKLLDTLEKVQETANILITDAAELGGEWEQEIATEIMDFTGRFTDIIDEYTNLVEEARSISEDSEENDAYDDLDEE